MKGPAEHRDSGPSRGDEPSGRMRTYGAGSSVPGMVDRRKPERRALFLADISKTLFETLDYEQTLERVARLAMPELGAWCIVDLITDGQEIQRLAVFHPDPRCHALAAELAKQYPPAPTDLFGAPRILRTQQPELMPELSAELLRTAAHDKRHFEILRTMGLCTFMVVPLKARGKLLGAITFVGAESSQRYTPKDLLFAEDLAGRAATAMDNAKLYQEAQVSREEAVAAVARAAIADRAKTDFLATMSHELRTPLNAIAGYAELLELGMRGPISDQQREAISRIRKSQQHLLGIVNDILTFAKTETGRIPIHLQPTPVADAVQAVHFLVEPLLAQQGIEYSFEDCAPEAAVMADRDRLQQILVNLLTNAAKFSNHGGSVRVRCEVREHLLAILVEDKGPGIEPDMLEAIFEPFVQLSTGLTRKAEGSGLGLAISRELARLMGGDVTVESTAGEGSTFTLTLPLSPGTVPFFSSPVRVDLRAWHRRGIFSMLSSTTPGSFPGVLVDGRCRPAYARFLEGPESDLLARFVLPMSRLDEFSVTAAPFLPRGESTEPWRLSVIGGNDAAAARDAALSFNCSHWNGSDKGHAVCDAIELQVKDAESVQNVVDAVPDFFQLFLEVPAAGDPERLIAAMAHTRAAAKIRTGGVTPEAIPSSQSVLHFMKSCRHYGVPFKATAGLHHAVRAIYPLTYEQGAPVAEMFGYLNVFLAAAAVNEGASDEIALGILEERDASRFVFDDSGLTWRDFKIGADRLMLARAGFARSFGSCSFTEPVQEGKELGLV